MTDALYYSRRRGVEIVPLCVCLTKWQSLRPCSALSGEEMDDKTLSHCLFLDVCHGGITAYPVLNSSSFKFRFSEAVGTEVVPLMFFHRLRNCRSKLYCFVDCLSFFFCNVTAVYSPPITPHPAMLQCDGTVPRPGSVVQHQEV